MYLPIQNKPGPGGKYKKSDGVEEYLYSLVKKAEDVKLQKIMHSLKKVKNVSKKDFSEGWAALGCRNFFPN